MIAVAIVLLIWLGIVAVCVNGAHMRGRNAAAWGLFALLFGLFAVVALYLLPPRVATTGGSARPIPIPPPDRDLDRLEKLHELLASGALSQAEYERQKALVLGSSLPAN